jgi:hypothetical protein
MEVPEVNHDFWQGRNLSLVSPSVVEMGALLLEL